jgi:NAD-dependent DNA ligase
MLVPFYLMCAYAYYKLDQPIISDDLFDKMAKDLLKHYDKIEHFHKHLITRGDLEAGTYLGEYPERVANGLSHFVRS